MCRRLPAGSSERDCRLDRQLSDAEIFLTLFGWAPTQKRLVISPLRTVRLTVQLTVPRHKLGMPEKHQTQLRASAATYFLTSRANSCLRLLSYFICFDYQPKFGVSMASEEAYSPRKQMPCAKCGRGELTSSHVPVTSFGRDRQPVRSQPFFLVLDAQSIEDGTCLFVCTRDAPLQSLRCDFDRALQCANLCDIGRSIEDGFMGSFMRSGVIMTKANQKLAGDGGLYIEGGEVKLNQAWRDFRK
ncbi:hypothetical protein FPV67DRAFT_1723631 [Lyophyllum atratum]|nr:hypothetical protein FPV67DRAFT_1723631 [Lyophyllum atratum]